MQDLTTLLAQAGAIIFDCDGTLVNTLPIYSRAWMAGFLRSGKPITADWYLARAGMSEYLLMDAFEAETGLKLNRQSEGLEAARQAGMQAIDVANGRLPR